MIPSLLKDAAKYFDNEEERKRLWDRAAWVLAMREVADSLHGLPADKSKMMVPSHSKMRPALTTEELRKMLKETE